MVVTHKHSFHSYLTAGSRECRGRTAQNLTSVQDTHLTHYPPSHLTCNLSLSLNAYTGDRESIRLRIETLQMESSRILLIYTPKGHSAGGVANLNKNE